MRKIVKGREYNVRSPITGKTRSVRAVEIAGQRIVCIADDNGRKLIVSRRRLRRGNILLADNGYVGACSDDTARLVDELIRGRAND